MRGENKVKGKIILAHDPPPFFWGGGGGWTVVEADSKGRFLYWVLVLISEKW